MIRQKIDSKSPNFIGCWKIKNSKLFDQIINFFELNSQIQNRGYVSDRIDEQIKKTTDITIDPIDLKKKEY